MNVGFISLGCARNQVDTEIMLNILKKSGHRIVNSIERADAVIINTCGFINDAKQESIDTIIETGRLKDSGAVKYIVATGCLVQRYGKEIIDELPELDGILGISHFKEIDKAISAVENGEKQIILGDAPVKFIENGPRVLTTPPGMAYLKIAEGCNNCCSYCAIPSIKGRLRSRPIEDIEQEARVLANKGIKELVIIAQDTAAYGMDIYNKKSLPDVLKRLSAIDELSWVRVMYLHPAHFDWELIETIAREEKVIPYLDIPVQHASDRILEKMNRRHDFEHLQTLISDLRREIEDLVLRTTVMLGFPGEEEQDYKKLYDFVAESKFDCLGTFAFTSEEGTRAELMDDQVPAEVAQQRVDSIMRLQKNISRDKNIKRIGRKERILVSSQLDKNLYIGRGYYQAPEIDGVTIIKTPVRLKKGEFVEVELKGVRDYDMIGEIDADISET